MAMMDRRPWAVCPVCDTPIMLRLSPDNQWKIRDHYRMEHSSMLCSGSGTTVSAQDVAGP